MILKAFFKGIFISTRDFAKQWIIGDIYLLTHIVHQSAAFVISFTSFKLLPKDFWTSLSTAAPLSTWAPPPAFKHALLWPYTRTLYSIWVFNQFLPHATFMYFSSYQISVKFISICFPQLFYVACLLHALWLPPLFTADFFTLSTVCEWRWYQNITTGFLLVSFTLSKRQALCIPSIDSSHIKTS